jgi:TPR repeat protein
MDFEIIKAHIDDIVYNNSHVAYNVFIDMCDRNIIIPKVQSELYEYINSLKNINGNVLVLFGDIYFYGLHVIKNRMKSIEMYNKAITMDNNILGHFNIAYIYQYGDYKNIDLAIKHYTIAANGGCTISQYNLGVLYTPVDIYLATEWYEMAAISKHGNSLNKLAELYIDVDVVKSIGYYKLAIKQNPDVKIAYDKILQKDKHFAIIDKLLNEISIQSNDIKKLKKETIALKIQIEEMELMPEGKKYKEAKEHFDLLAKSSGGIE